MPKCIVYIYTKTFIIQISRRTLFGTVRGWVHSSPGDHLNQEPFWIEKLIRVWVCRARWWHPYMYIYINTLTWVFCADFDALATEGNELTHWGPNKITIILQKTFPSEFSWMKMVITWFKSHGSSFSLLSVMTRFNRQSSSDQILSYRPLVRRKPQSIMLRIDLYTSMNWIIIDSD